MNEPKLTLQDLKDIRWRWLRPETALLAHDHKQLKLVFDALLASQTALRKAEWGRVGVWNCPVCHAKPYVGHEPDCELRAALLD